MVCSRAPLYFSIVTRGAFASTKKTALRFGKFSTADHQIPGQMESGEIDDQLISFVDLNQHLIACGSNPHHM
ncbi:MAG: hypothetical protein Ct9H90mP25_4580 [Gammaproteobacteria bacterium]|nr:MAG: hypothetical protein Ct9H90mP25_4580 [Gammaproteobacteria bacterium]